MHLPIQQPETEELQGEPAVHEGPRLGKERPHAPYRARVHSELTSLLSPFRGHTLPGEGKGKQLSKDAVEVAGESGHIYWDRGQNRLGSGRRNTCNRHRGRPAERGKGAAMLRRVQAALGIRPPALRRV